MYVYMYTYICHLWHWDTFPGMRLQATRSSPQGTPRGPGGEMWPHHSEFPPEWWRVPLAGRACPGSRTTG